MLFREADLADPANTPVFKALWELDDPTVTNLVALLVIAARRPVADTPWLDEVLEGGKAVPVSDTVLAHAAKVLGVTRRAARKPLPVANLYVVPEEANQFIEMGRWSRKRRRSPSVPFLAAGGFALLAAIVITIVMVTWGGKGATPLDPGTSPATPAIADTGPPSPIAKPGVIETKWAAITPGPAITIAKGLVSGIDVVPPNTKIVRSYPLAGMSVLAAWPLPDGAHALVVSKTGIGVLDLDTAQVQPFKVSRSEIIHAAISTDRKYVVVGVKDHSIRCFDIAKGESRWSKKFPGAIGALATTPDGQRVAATAEKVGYMEWSVADGSELRRHESLQATHLVFTPDGHFAVAAGEAGVELWSLDDAKIRSLDTSIFASAVAISPDGKQALASAGNDLKSWTLPDGKSLPDRSSTVKHPISALSISSDGTLLVGSQNGEVALLGADETMSAVSRAGDSGGIVSFGVTQDGAYALATSEKGSIALCRVADLVRPLGPSMIGPTAGCLEYARSLPIAPEYTMFAVGAKGDQFLTASSSKVMIFDAAKFTKLDQFQLTGGHIVAAGFGPDDKIIVCQTEEERFVTRSFNPKKKLDSGPPFTLPKDEPGRISRITPVRDHPWVIATTEFAGDVLFDPATGLVVEGWPAPDANKPLVASPSPDGRFIAIGSSKEPVQLWSCDTSSISHACEASSGIACLEFAPDGKQLVGLWPRGRLRTWVPDTGKLIREVDHDYRGPFAIMSAVTNDVVVLGAAPERLLLSLETGKGLSTGDGPDPLRGRGPVIASRGLVLATDRESRLTGWNVEPRQGASLPPKPPGRSSWPDVRVMRDASREPPIGMAFSADGQSLILATNSSLEQYSSSRLILAREIVADELPLQAMVRTQDELFTLGKKNVVTIRDAKTLFSQDEIETTIPAKSKPTLFVVHPLGTFVLVVADKPRLFDVKARKETSVASAPKAAYFKSLTQFAFSADGEVGVARWGDAVTAVWQPKMMGAAKVLQESKPPVPASPHALAVSGDGKFAVLGTGDGRLTIFDLGAGKIVHEEPEAYPPSPTGDAVVAVAMIPGTAHFVTAGRNGHVIVWNLQGFRKVKEYVGPDGPWRMVVAPDGKSVFMQQPGIMQIIDLPKLPRS